MPGPALEHLVYDARLPDDVVGSLAAALLIGHAPAEVVPFGLACLLGAQHAAHLGDPTGKAQHAGVLHDHGAVAARARDDGDPGARELHERLDELGAGLAGPWFTVALRP